MKKIIFLLLFLLLPNLAWGATYYMRADGTAANVAAATGPCGTVGNCMSVATHNAGAIAAGDIINLCDDGGDYRASLIHPNPGTSGSRITYQAATGDSPVIKGSDYVTVWSDSGSDVWEATLTTEPSQVFLNGTKGTKVASEAECNDTNKWYWADGVHLLYIYSVAGDPGDVNIEASIRVNSIMNWKSYLTFSGIHVTHNKATTTYSDAALYMGNNVGTIVDNCHFDYNDVMGGTVYLDGTSGSCTISNNTIHNNNYDFAITPDRGAGIIVDGTGGSNIITGNTIYSNTGPGIKLGFLAASSSNTISNNTVYSNGGANLFAGPSCASNIFQNNTVYENGQLVADTYNIDLFRVGNNNIVRYNLTHDFHYISSDGGGIRFDAGAEVFGTGNQIYYNIIYNEREGINLLGCDGAVVYNNSIYNSGLTGIHVHGADADANIVKNNIVHTAGTNLIYNQDATNSVINYNLYWDVALGTKFNWNDVGHNFVDWQAHQDANSLTPADPLFVSAMDFHLQSGSPCHDKGTNVGLSSDYSGKYVPRGIAPDIGAYEYGGRMSLSIIGVRPGDDYE